MLSILVTGCSSGIGLATALDLARRGHRVFATMRNPARAPHLAEQAARESLPVSIHTMDVDSDDSVAACFAAVYREAGVIDVLVNNAGVECHGALEELSMEAIRATMETNYFGALRCIKQVVRQMRERRSGCIVNVTSVSGRLAASPLGAYAASKHALEAASEALAQELKSFGVRVAIIEPGIIDTPMAHSIENPPASVYGHARHLAALFQESLKTPTPPSVVAEVIRGVIESGTGKLRHPAGPDAMPFLSWRASKSDEEWIAFNAQDDEGYRAAVLREFGMSLRFE